MSSREYVVLIERDQDGLLVGSIPGIRGCHTQAKTLPLLMSRIQEVVKLCLKSEKNLPKPLKFVGLQEIQVAF